MPKNSSQNSLFDTLKERILGLLGSALLVIFFSALAGWIGGAVYKWGDERIKREKLLEMAKRSDISEIDKYLIYLREAAKDNPSNEKIRLELANVYVSKGRINQKTLYYNEAVVEAEEGWKIHLVKNNNKVDLSKDLTFIIRSQLAGIYDETGRRKEAREVYYEMLDFLKENSNAEKRLNKKSLISFYNNASYFLLMEKNPAEEKIETAYQLIKKCIKSGPEASSNPAFLDTLALALYKKGKKEEALQAAKEALAKADNFSLETYINRFKFIKKSLELQ